MTSFLNGGAFFLFLQQEPFDTTHPVSNFHQLPPHTQAKAATAAATSGSVASAERVLEEWFGKLPVGLPAKGEETAWERNYRLKWFATANRRTQVDAAITRQFGATLAEAEKRGLGMLDATPGWSRANPRHLVAFIVVLDQFSRHIYRVVRRLG